MTTSKEPTDTLLAILHAKPGCEPQLEARLTQLVTETSRELGVRIYAVHRNIDVNGQYVVYERYFDTVELKAHLASEHLKQAMMECAPLLSDPPQMIQCVALAGLPYRRSYVDDLPVDTYVVSIGPVALTFARAKRGLLTCGAILPSALDAFQIASARVRPASGSIGSLEELLRAKVVECNQRASASGVALEMTGREALFHLGQ